MMPRSRSPRSLGTILASEQGMVAHLGRRSEELLALDRRLRSLLPSPLSKHCRVANIRRNTIIVHVDSAAWATQLRFLTSQLAIELGGRAGMSVKIKVQPPAATPSRSVRGPLRLSPRAAAELDRAAAHLGEDDPLARTLRRLARRGR